MANTLTDVTPQLLAQGLMALRAQAITPAVFNRDYEKEAGEQGSTVDVPIPSAIAVNDVTPGPTPPAGTDIVFTKVPIALSRWKEARFNLSDKEQMEVQAGTIPSVASEATGALADELDAFVLGLGSKFFSAANQAGGDPFTTDVGDVTDARKELNRFKCPMNPRFMIIDPDAEASALQLRAFHDASFSFDANGIREGQIGRKFGFGWLMDQNVQNHTNGAGTAYITDGTPTLGSKAIVVDTGSGTLNAGDLVTFAGHAQTYVLTAALTAPGTMAIEPGLQAAVADGAAITTVNTAGTTYANNIAAHRDAIAIATRPLAQSAHPNAIISSSVDPISSLALRLEFSREHKRDAWSFDILYGAEVVRRELGARVIGA